MTDSATTRRPNPPPLRQCGRCRLYFPAADDIHPAELKQWWACDDCSTRIIPSHRRAPTNDAAALPDDRT